MRVVRHTIHHAGVIRVRWRKRGVVEEVDGNRHRVVFRQLQQLALCNGCGHIGAHNQQRSLGVEQRVVNCCERFVGGQRRSFHRLGATHHGIHILGIEGLTGKRQVHRARGFGEGLFEGAAYRQRHTPRIPHLPAVFGDILHRVHLREAAADAKGVVIAERSVVAHGCRHHQRRAVEVRIEKLPRALPRARCEVHVHEAGLPAGAGVGIRRRQHQRFVQQQDRLHSRHSQKGIKKTRLRAAGVRERVFDTLRYELVHQKLATRAANCLRVCHGLLRSSTRKAIERHPQFPAHPAGTAAPAAAQKARA